MGIVSSVSIQKGGPGKTTVCLNLAVEVAETGRKVLLIDNDPQGNLTRAILGDELPEAIEKVSEAVTSVSQKLAPGVSNSYWFYEKGEIPEPHIVTDNLHIIGSTKHLALMGTRSVDSIYEFSEKIEMLAEGYDDVFIDCSPAAGTLQTAAHGASDYLIIPTELNEDSIDGVRQQLESAAINKKRLNKKLEVLGILVNSKNSHKIVIEEAYHDTLKTLYKEMLFITEITKSVKVAEARCLNLSVGQHAPKSVQAKQYATLAEEYLERSRGVGHVCT